MDEGGIPQLEPVEAMRRMDAGALLLDVREPHEWAAARVPGAWSIPMSEVEVRWKELPPDRPVLVFCAGGARSQAVARFLRHMGVADTANVAGGIYAWHAAGLPLEA